MKFKVDSICVVTGQSGFLLLSVEFQQKPECYNYKQMNFLLLFEYFFHIINEIIGKWLLV
jgi:hypothetical protein